MPAGNTIAAVRTSAFGGSAGMEVWGSDLPVCCTYAEHSLSFARLYDQKLLAN